MQLPQRSFTAQVAAPLDWRMVGAFRCTNGAFSATAARETADAAVNAQINAQVRTQRCMRYFLPIVAVKPATAIAAVADHVQHGGAGKTGDADHEGRDEPRDEGRGGSGAMGTVKIPPTTADELRHAIEADRQRRATERRAVSVRYDPDRDAIDIELTDGAGVRLPRATVEEFRYVPPADMAKLRVSPAGYGIKLDEHDINIGVHGLVAALATARDMAPSLGKLAAPRDPKRSESAHGRTARRAGGRGKSRSPKRRHGLRDICYRSSFAAATFIQIVAAQTRQRDLHWHAVLHLILRDGEGRLALTPAHQVYIDPQLDKVLEPNRRHEKQLDGNGCSRLLRQGSGGGFLRTTSARIRSGSNSCDCRPVGSSTAAAGRRYAPSCRRQSALCAWPSS